MPPEAGKQPIPSDTLQAYAEVLPHFEVKNLRGGDLRFKCAHCFLAFSRSDFESTDQAVSMLKDHVVSHARPTVQAKAYQQARAARRRGLDAAGRPEQSKFALDYGDE